MVSKLTLVLLDAEIVVRRELEQPFVCLCQKEYLTKNDLKNHVPKCTVVSSVKSEGK